MVNTHDHKQLLIGQVAVVTGGSRGIGRAIALALAAEGASVAVVARSEEQLAETTMLIREMGGEAIAIVGDVSDRQAVVQMAKQVVQQLGPVDILVNNAGRHYALGPLWLVDPDEWLKDVEGNLFSTFLCMHAIMPGMIERRQGRIINISSGAGNLPRPHSTAYTSSKAAVTRLTESAAISARPYDISIFAIHPGSVRTAMADYLVNSEEANKWVPEFRTIYDETEIPAERVGELVVFLASGKADLLTGRFLNVYDDIQELVRQAAAIQQQDLYTLRLRQ
ncbi:SDR family NAD(P)-dependent oxidoreductase [Ktedonobacter racemifer]|uniref:Short-chain dehydrogenase/reductase SDR n=1 Tax=Ktedonobacter racemifer DSM 44963 TaxID=485913 RepID=D6TTB4_KTERA|nr:SDR family oxidoreductase [Ktedonobacter racemifer]EFH83665.1 short-chain dehydrogenase/reductase SDR [Ktedonobacter racemifer DSM 44963]